MKVEAMMAGEGVIGRLACIQANKVAYMERRKEIDSKRPDIDAVDLIFCRALTFIPCCKD